MWKLPAENTDNHVQAFVTELITEHEQIENMKTRKRPWKKIDLEYVKLLLEPPVKKVKATLAA